MSFQVRPLVRSWTSSAVRWSLADGYDSTHSNDSPFRYVACSCTLFRMDLNHVVAELTAERNRIDQAIAALEGSEASSRPRRGRPPKAPSSQPASGKRKMNAAARAR